MGENGRAVIRHVVDVLFAICYDATLACLNLVCSNIYIPILKRVLSLFSDGYGVER